MRRAAMLIFSATLGTLAAGQENVTPLESGQPVERQLASGETHSYSLALETGDFLRMVFDQRGIDVVVTVYGPDQQKVVDVNASDARGTEMLELIARTAGTYQVQVRAFVEDAKQGRYEARVDALMSASVYAAEQALTEEAAKEIARVLVPLRTAEAGEGFDDLQPLRRVVGNARLVTLGEATHGTREFFQLKHRVLEFLVAQMGFTVFGIEGSMPEAFDINEYILTGNGDPRKALSSLYYFAWDTEEVLEMIEWMRRYNADPAHRRKVKFYGFDMSQPVRASRVTLDYLKTVDPKFGAEAADVLEVLTNPITQGDFYAFTPEKKQSAFAMAQRILARFDDRKQAWMKKTDATAWAIARQHAHILAQNIDERTNDPGRKTVRPRSMADNIQWILQHEGPGARMVAWAHNNHVATDENSMGTFLRKMFGQDMVTFGFAFNQGSFQAIEPGIGLRQFTVPPARAGSFDAVMASAGTPLAVIDFRSLSSSSALAKWLSESRMTRDIGGTYREADEQRTLVKRNMPDRYDGLFFVETTTSARSNPYARVVSKIERHVVPENPDFEDRESDGSPSKWVLLPPTPEKFDFEITTTEDNPRSGARSGVIRRSTGKHYGEAGGSILQWVDATPYRDKEVRFRASVRSRGESSRTFLWLKVYGAFEERTEVTNGDWKEYELVRKIPADAVVIEYGMALTGDGEASIDAVALEVIETAAPEIPGA
ncbi:MAG TPA: erythromycin esterase family protein [Thermoanaerobaculia bacterium]|nr:erythromycin esterase family protein [Thermoanaerobaculia bacterium]